MFDVVYGLFDKLCTKNNSKHQILITLGNTSAKSKGPECTIAYNNIERRFPNHGFYINFGLSKQSPC